MPSGRPWTRTEIEHLFQAMTAGGCTLALSAELARTHDAVIAKAKRLNIRGRDRVRAD